MNPRLKNALFSHAEIKTAERVGDDLFIEGVASTGKADRANEIVDQASLQAAAGTYTTRTIFHQHNWDAPIGEAVDLRFEGENMVVRGKIGRDYDIPVVVSGMLGPMGVAMTSVNNIRKQIEQGVLRAYSIGFTAETSYQKDEDGREDHSKPAILKVQELLELSVVTIPANRDCLFSLAKSYTFDEISNLYQPEDKHVTVGWTPESNTLVWATGTSTGNSFASLGDGSTSDGEDEWEDVIGGLNTCLTRLKSQEW